MKRVLLFLVTNLAVVFVLSISLRLLGVDRILDEQGIGLDLNALLVFSGVFGFGGALISLAISKWTAKRLTGARVIEQPTHATERWLVETVRRQAQGAGIGTPEVAIYEAPDVNAFATGMSRNHALVAVSTGLLQSMNRDEAEAVLGHEVSHIANGDMVTLALITSCGQHLCDLSLPRRRPLGRSPGVQNRTGTWAGILGDRNRRRAHVGDPGEHHRHVV